MQYKMTFSVNRKAFEYYFSCYFFAWTKKVTKKSQENPIRIRTGEPEHGGFSGHHTLSKNLLVINQLKKYVIGSSSKIIALN